MKLEAPDESTATLPRRPLIVVLGSLPDGRSLAYCEDYVEFSIDGEPALLSTVRELDRCGRVRWRFLEQRDWLRRLDDESFEAKYLDALARRGDLEGASTLEAQIREHVRKDNSYLFGQIVDTNAEEAAREAQEAAEAEARAEAEAKAAEEERAAEAKAEAQRAGAKTDAEAREKARKAESQETADARRGLFARLRRERKG